MKCRLVDNAIAGGKSFARDIVDDDNPFRASEERKCVRLRPGASGRSLAPERAHVPQCSNTGIQPP